MLTIPRHNSPGTRMIEIPNDPSPIFERLAASRTGQPKHLRAYASLRRTDSPSALSYADHALYSHTFKWLTLLAPPRITRRNPDAHEYQNDLVHFRTLRPYAAQVPSASLPLAKPARPSFALGAESARDAALDSYWAIHIEQRISETDTAGFHRSLAKVFVLWLPSKYCRFL